ncbi:hypothetical protein OIU76_001135, partial [Salix suchowensis]
MLMKRGEEDKGGDLHHPVVSHEYSNGLAVESAWIGTRDYSAQLVVPSVLEVLNRFEGGIEGIKKRNHEKVKCNFRHISDSLAHINLPS